MFPESIDDPPLMGALLRMPLDAWRQRMVDDLHTAGFTDLVMAHLAVLRYPGPQGRRPSDVAAEAGMSRQAMNYLLGELEELGYLQRRRDPEDKRARRIELTERGHAVRRVMRGIVADVEADLVRELGADEMAQLRRLLISLNGSEFVRDYRKRTGHPSVIPQSTGSDGGEGAHP
jgi:DNA-binding MarR family transcriptional regulator